MALNSSVLNQAIKARLTSELGFDFNEVKNPSALDIILEEIVNHIKSFAEVNTNVSTQVQVNSVTGVTAGPGISGPGAGQGNGTGVGKVS